MSSNFNSLFPSHSVRLFALIAFVAIATALGLTWKFVERATHESVLSSTEAANLAITTVFVNEAWADVSALLPAPDSAPQSILTNPFLRDLDERVRRFDRSTDIVKVKIFNLKGLTVYSSDPVQLGEDKSKNAGFASALAGKPASELTFRGKFNSFDGELTDRNLVSSYMPVRANGKVISVVEIYTDRTASVQSTDQQLRNLFWLLVPVFLTVYLGLLIFVRQTEAAQRQHEQSLRKLALESAAARLAAEQANAGKSAFLATMSHEIRTPMNGVLGMAQLLMLPNLEEVERLDYARTILNSGQTLLTLLNDILDLSKVEAGKLDLETKAFEPAQILHEIGLLFSEAASRKGLTLTDSWSGPAQHYLGDAHRVRQMVSNLVGNAIKFTAQGTIRVEAREVDGDVDGDGDGNLLGGAAQVEFAVIDSGIGVPQEQQAQLFQPFSQADNSTTRMFGGTGLGLSIVRSLARLMGGDAGVESTPGQGSRFWFRIGLERVAAGTDNREMQRAQKANATANTKPVGLSGHVLVVEDNRVNQRVIRALLDSLGLTCVVEEDGQQGFDAVKRAGNAARPDLILMDLQMPVLDGYAATAKIRLWEAESSLPRLPIIALTADAFAEDQQHCIDAGMDDFLAKPVDRDALAITLRRWLPSRASGANLQARTPTTAQDQKQGQDQKLPESPVTDSPIDVVSALQRMGGNVDLYWHASKDFCAELRTVPAQYTELLDASSMSGALRLMHTLKGTAGTLGAVKLAALAANLERVCRSSDKPELARQGLTSLTQEIAATQDALEQALAKLPRTQAPTVSAVAASRSTVVAALEELQALLAASDMLALERFDALRDTLANLPLGDFDQLEVALQNLDFDAALALCRKSLGQEAALS